MAHILSDPAPLAASSIPSQPAGGLGALLDALAATGHDGRISVGDLVETFGARGFLPVLLVLALIVVSPLSGIPLLPTVCGLMIFLVAMQMAAGRSRLWLPRWLRRQSLPQQRVAGAIRRTRPVADWFDRHSDRRLPLLTTAPALKLLQLAAGLCGLAMPFLELIPFSSSLLALAICLMGLAMLSRDGLWAAVSLLPVAGAVAIILSLWA